MSAAPGAVRMPARTIELAGRPVALDYGDIEAEYHRLRASAAIVDRQARGRMRMDGPHAAAMLNGLVTNDVEALPVGRGAYAAALSPKGRIVADVRIYRVGEHRFFVDTPIRARDGWMAMVRKYVNPRLAPYADASDTMTELVVAGEDAARAVSAALDMDREALEALPPYGVLRTGDGDDALLVARDPAIRVPAFAVIAPAAQRDSLWLALAGAGAAPAGHAAWEIARVEAGQPEWGIDIDDTTIPQEANFDELHAISYTKGCYVGQEVVARIHFRGHVNRHLRGLLCGETLPPHHAALHDESGKAIGDVRSAVRSPRLGAIAIGMVRREVPLGTTLEVRWDGGESRADVVALPFP